MRNFSKFPPETWRDPCFRELGSEQQLVCLYVRFGPHQTSAGLAYLPCSYISADLSIDESKARSILRKLAEKGFAREHPSYHLVYANNWFVSNGPQNEKHYKGIMKELDRFPPCELVDLVRGEAEAAEVLRREKAKSVKKALDLEQAAKSTAYLANTGYMNPGIPRRRSH